MVKKLSGEELKANIKKKIERFQKLEQKWMNSEGEEKKENKNELSRYKAAINQFVYRRGMRMDYDTFSLKQDGKTITQFKETITQKIQDSNAGQVGKDIVGLIGSYMKPNYKKEKEEQNKATGKRLKEAREKAKKKRQEEKEKELKEKANKELEKKTNSFIDSMQGYIDEIDELDNQDDSIGKISDLVYKTTPTVVPQISELMDGKVEVPENVENLNQNVAGANEGSSRSFQQDLWNSINGTERKQAANIQNGLYEQTEEFLRQDINEMKLNESKMEQKYLDVPTQELDEAETYFNSRQNPSNEQKIVNTDDIKASYKSNLLAQIISYGEMNGVKLPSQLLGNASVDNLEEVVEQFTQNQGTLDRLGDHIMNNVAEELNIDVDTIKESLGKIRKVANTAGDTAVSVVGTLNRMASEAGVLSNMQKKINNMKEAGASKNDIRRQGYDHRGERKDGREEKHNKERRPPVPPVPSWMIDDLKNEQKQDILGNVQGENENVDQPASVSIADQVNNINKRLEELSTGSLDRSSSMKYPESRKIRKYRFPKANENYSAVPLVQNAVSSYLNDVNLYGDVDGGYEENNEI
jgi:hypothetical protein